jgi:hypothetical protein
MIGEDRTGMDLNAPMHREPGEKYQEALDVGCGGEYRTTPDAAADDVKPARAMAIARGPGL